jgi:hypothetical protein
MARKPHHPEIPSPDIIIPNTIGAYLLRISDDAGYIVSEKLPIIGWQCLPDPTLLGMPLTICAPVGPTIEFIVYSDRYFWNDECGVMEGESTAIEWARWTLLLLRTGTEEASEATQH